MPTRLIFFSACSTVMFFFRSTYSTVMMLPALSSGYFKRRLMICRVSLSVTSKICSTTLAGISSMISTVSSMYISSNSSLISERVNALIKVSCMGDDISVNTSAAFSFWIRRNRIVYSFSVKFSNNDAKSTLFIELSTTFKAGYSRLMSRALIFSSLMFLSPFI